MSLLSDFEDRVARAVEGVFAGAFRSPVQPAEIAKALAKAMDDGRTVGVGRVYAPLSYRVALSSEDAEKLGSFTVTLSSELARYLAGHASERGYHLTTKPAIAFTVHDDLRLGRFRVSAELAATDDESAPEEDLRDPVSMPARRRRTVEVEPPGGHPLRDLATVTVGEVHHDVVLRGERLVIGRLNACDICLSDVNASRRHAVLEREGDGWTVADLDSTNGTLLNGVPVQRERLRDGDVIEIGLTRLVYHEPRG